MHKSILLFFLIAVTSARLHPHIIPYPVGGDSHPDGGDNNPAGGDNNPTGGDNNPAFAYHTLSQSADYNTDDYNSNNSAIYSGDSTSMPSITDDSNDFPSQTISLESSTSTSSLASGLTVITKTFVSYATYTFPTFGVVTGSLVLTTTITRAIGEAPLNRSVPMGIMALFIAIISLI